MYKEYPGVVTRFLRQDERLILSEENEMPLVIEADGDSNFEFLQHFLASNSHQILKDLAHYGAVLLRGFTVETDEQFEKIILSIPEFRGIREAFMSENGRDLVNNLQYVLHTNSVYKTRNSLSGGISYGKLLFCGCSKLSLFLLFPTFKNRRGNRIN